MAVDIGPRIGIDGEKEYRQEINNIITQAKTLSSEMKAVTSSFDKNTSAEEKATRTSEVLTKQIETQEKRVDLLREMLDKSREATGDNSNETLKWQQAVNNATAELNGMRNKLSDLNGGLNDTEQDLKDVGEETGKAGQQALSFGDIVKANVISDAIIKGFDALKGAVTGLVGAFKDMAFESAFYADEIATMSTVTGLSTDTLQEFTYMAELVDTSVSTITGSMTKMTKTMASAQSGSKSAQDTFKQLGVSFKNADGSLRNTEDTFYDIIEALGKIDNEAELDALAMGVFGKSAKDLKPLIDAGTEGIEAFRKEAQEMGFVLDDSQIKSLLGVSDAYERWNNMLTTVKNTIGVGLAPALETLINAMREWVSTIDWEAVGEQIGGLFSKMVDTLTSVDLSEVITRISDGVVGFAQAVGSFDFAGFFKTVKETMNFITNWGPKIVAVISSIGAVVVGLKLGALITSIGSVGQAIGALTNPIGLAVTAIGVISYAVQNWGTISERAMELWEKAKEAISATFEKLKNTVTGILDTLKSNAQQKWDEMKTKAEDTFARMKEKVVETFENIKTGISEKAGAIKEAVSGAVQGALDVISGLVSGAWNWGSDLMENLKSGIASKIDAIKRTASNVANVIKSFLGFSEPEKGPLSDFHTYMPDMMKLMAQGINDNAYLVEDAMQNLAGNMAQQTSEVINYGGVTVNVDAQGMNGRELVDQIEQELTTRMLRRKAVY